jgi:hypothetical protein
MSSVEDQEECEGERKGESGGACHLPSLFCLLPSPCHSPSLHPLHTLSFLLPPCIPPCLPPSILHASLLHDSPMHPPHRHLGPSQSKQNPNMAGSSDNNKFMAGSSDNKFVCFFNPSYLPFSDLEGQLQRFLIHRINFTPTTEAQKRCVFPQPKPMHFPCSS